MTETQTNHEKIADDLFVRLREVAWELDVLQGIVASEEALAKFGSPMLVWCELLNRHIVAARGLATDTLHDHAEALDKELAFPWDRAVCEIRVGGRGGDEADNE